MSPHPLAIYKAKILPLLRDAGFRGTVANMMRVDGRRSLLAYSSRWADDLKCGITGTDGRKSFSFADALIPAGASAGKKLAEYEAHLRDKVLPKLSPGRAPGP